MGVLYLVIIIIPMVLYSKAWRPHYNLGTTDRMNIDLSHHCLWKMINKKQSMKGKTCRTQHIIEYCIRPSSKENDSIINGSISSIWTFDQLKKRNVTAQNLIEWSSPIDLAEIYQSYLKMPNSSSAESFYNCTEQWFGPFCQYTFDLDKSFSNIVDMTFYRKPLDSTIDYNTCYVHLKCNRGRTPFCLDWREICDGKIDCLDSGDDEKHCLELEINQCADNEYQCRNGMCVDEAFFFDDCGNHVIPECLDGTDTIRLRVGSGCYMDITFTCEDTACDFPFDFACGDGQCITMPIPGNIIECRNGRDKLFNIMIGKRGQETTSIAHCLDVIICGILVSTWDFQRECNMVCKTKQECQRQIPQICPSSFFFFGFPLWDNHVRLGYFSNRSFPASLVIEPHFVCYDQYRCPFLTPSFQVGNYTCRHIHELNLTVSGNFYMPFSSCYRVYQTGDETQCSAVSMFRCPGTNKCIPARRIMDGIVDCYNGFDESVSANSCELNDKYRFQCISEKKCFSRFLVGDHKKQCLDGEDEFKIDEFVFRIQELEFSRLCDGRVDLIYSENGTDETNCERWKCVNQYTLCNLKWNCPKGIDELNCTFPFSCPADYHPCHSRKNGTMTCLHVNYTDDGIVDCSGATDERTHCRVLYPFDNSKRYRCWNDTKCVTHSARCEECGIWENIGRLCDRDDRDNVREYLQLTQDSEYMTRRAFSPVSSHIFPPTLLLPSVVRRKHNQVTHIERLQNIESIDNRRAWLCQRGIAIFVGNEKREQCLCPPSYYGHRCQYQNQRVSLTLRFRKASLVKLEIFGIIVTLVDHTGLIHSHDQFTYIATRDCNTKFNVYLLYQDRPKDMTKNYTIRIDAYHKMKFTYIASWILPIKFPFMPVNRVSAQLMISSQQTKVSLHHCGLSYDRWYPMQLIHTDMDSCRNDSDMSKGNSTVRYKCNCSSDSICVGFANNRSICLCPLTKIGPRCFLDSICQSDICKNGGLCVPGDDRDSLTDFVCLCQDGFSSQTCEDKDARIEISFRDMAIPQSILVHFITVEKDNLDPMPTPIRATTFKKISLDQDTVTFYMSLPFHLIVAQIEDAYYLAVLQHKYIPSANISTQIIPSQRCPHIRELLDERTFSYPILRRVKSYHVPCVERTDVVCFHDNDTFICLCTEERNANCFHFDFNMTYNCPGLNNCENDARCFQDHPTCPTKTMCVCQECFYGSQCQFTTKGFSLSLDAILGYSIRRHLSITLQPTRVKISIAMTIVMLVVGLISGILCILTFRQKLPREVGCGLYLLASSITSILIVIVFNFKFWILVYSQISIITSRSTLMFSCITIDFILRFLLAMADWFNTCVAVERVLTVILDVNFKKTKMKQAARWVILAVSLFTIISILHEPIHRRLIDDEDEGRTWCLVRFTHNVKIYDSIISIFHFITPFLINFISAISIIIIAARKRSSAKNKQTYKAHLYEQFHHHKQLIISPCILVLLAFPRLVVTLISGCMQSARDPGFFLVGYFVSFTPHLLTFFIFVLPSNMYKKEFNESIRRPWIAFRRRLNLG